MTKMGTATNKKIIELYNMLETGSLVLHPEFQRKLVWNDEHRENFIETVLMDLPFPEVYFADGEIDLDQKKSMTLVVDGQQRLSTIHRYIKDDKQLKLTRVQAFSDLSPEQKTRFYDYNVVVRDLGRQSEDIIKEIFKRINSIQYALNSTEINNALYSGEFIKTAKDLIDECALDKFEIFNEAESNRMADLDFILTIMATYEAGGYFGQNKEVETYIKLYDNEYPNKNIIKRQICDILNLIESINLKMDSFWYRKSSFFTLVMELLFFIKANGNLPASAELESTLVILEDRIRENRMEDKDSNEYSRFYSYMYQGTANRIARVARGELLRKYLFNSESW